MTGLEHIRETFAQAHQEGRAALMPYYTLGFPDPEVSLSIIEAIALTGADLIELGIPFSDPLADGPTIQHSTQVALQQGTTLSRCIQMAADLRSHGVHQPLIFMGYVNPILSYGCERFIADAVAAGVDGFIIPDLPPDGSLGLEDACRAHGCALIYLLAPTTPPERAALVTSRTSGFLYLVSLTGVTGARQSLAPDLEDFIQGTRQIASTPVAVGFGISTPEQASKVGQLADGVIVGSALINAVEKADHPEEAAARFIASLRQALTVSDRSSV
jgi:tryptophan synthase alpha chain